MERTPIPHRARALGIGAALLIVGAFGDVTGRWHPGWEHILLRGIVHESGAAYAAPLADARWSAMGGPSRAWVLEDGKLLGPGNEEHAAIRQEGHGRFSFWGNKVILSASDNSDVLTNGRVYAAWGPGPHDSILRKTLRGLAILSSLYLVYLTDIWRNSSLRTGLLAVVLGLTVPLTVELGLRLTVPFADTSPGGVFDPDVGFRLPPNTLIKHTNLLDYWTSTRTNSLGFADIEPIRHPGDCHISFIGDSFVEALQVPVEVKLQRVVEAEGRKRDPEWRLSTSAFGNSGTGQINQLPVYDKYVAPLAPRLVVLVLVSDDFANNSPILESLRNGWSPDAGPRLSARRSEETGEFTLVPISKDWSDHRLKNLPNLNGNSRHMSLKTHSYLYRWAFLKLVALGYPVSALDGPSFPEQVVDRARQLREDPRYARVMEDWNDRFAEALDGLFDEPLSPLYVEAFEATRFGLSEFKRRTSNNKSRLAVLVPSQLRWVRGGSLLLERVRGILKDLDIPMIDQNDYIQKHGGDPSAARFKNDSHWNTQGHRWAAEAVLDYLEKDRFICEAPAGN